MNVDGANGSGSAAKSLGDPSDIDRLTPLIYDELRALAAHFLAQERANHTLQPTALVHEAYMRLAQQSHHCQNKAQFAALAAAMIRRILVDHARGKARHKRGSEWRRIPLDGTTAASPSDENNPSVDLLDLDRALNELGRVSERQRRVVELRYFGGLSVPETAEALGVAPTTVKADWALARAWLFGHLRPAVES